MRNNLGDEPLVGDAEGLEMQVRHFFSDIEHYLEELTQSYDALESWLRKDRAALGLDPDDFSVGLSDHRICDMATAQVLMDELHTGLRALERYWVSTNGALPLPGPLMDKL